MLVGIEEIDPAAAEMMVDLAFLRPRRVGPIFEALALDPPEPGVELLVADQESIVLPGDLAVLLIIIERHAVLEDDDQEVEKAACRRQAEDVGQEGSRALLVAAPDDGVVELSHASTP